MQKISISNVLRKEIELFGLSDKNTWNQNKRMLRLLFAKVIKAFLASGFSQKFS